jgi:hypothetical protein
MEISKRLVGRSLLGRRNHFYLQVLANSSCRINADRRRNPDGSVVHTDYHPSALLDIVRL